MWNELNFSLIQDPIRIVFVQGCFKVKYERK